MIQDRYSENIMMSTEKGKAEMEYWFRKLQRDAAVSSFPKDNWYSKKQSAFSTIKYRFPDDVYQRIASLCNNSGYAFYILLLSGIKYILYKYTSNQDVAIGMPAFKQRTQGEFAQNVLALRTYIEDEDTFRSLLGRVKTTVLEADKNQNFPIGKTAELLNLKAEQDKYRFDTIVELEQIHRSECLECINADIIFSFSIEKDGLQLQVRYDRILFFESTVNQIITHLIRLLTVVSANPNTRLSEVEILSEKEKNHILYDFNDTQFDYQKDKTINELFEEQVNKTPNNTAVVFGTEEISYKQLNELSNQLAFILRQKGVKPDSIVGILAGRSIEMIVAILGVLKAGGSYLPIDPQYPEDRIRYMLEDSGTEILLTDKDTDAHNLISDNEFITIIKLNYNEHTGHGENLNHLNKADDLAYVIYTSGSTGKPKGVLLEHKGIANLKKFFSKEFAITDKDRIVQFASSSFDASVWEIFMALLAGASLYIVSEEIINDIERFQDFLNENCISIVTLPPVYLANMDPERVKTLRKIITAGSSAIQRHVKKWNGKVEYINAYGPTETTICATSFLCDERIDSYNSVPIGKPIMNARILILDKKKRIVPEGVAGELCISGDMLARGYLKRPELTAEKFISNPYFPGERLYRTGDLARWLPDGNIEFMGRIDHQVKVRGYRVEPGEIESMLSRNDDISETLVITSEDKAGDRYLCAYIVAKRKFKVQELKDYLSRELPEYMIPAFFIQLESMPLTPSGKIDRNMLPPPDKGIYSEHEYIAPRNETEEKIATVWSEVLGLERAGIMDSFFELGGDSIKAIQVLSRLSKYQLKLEMKDLFHYKTIEELAKVVVKGSKLQISQIPVTGEVNLTPIQRWFFENKFTDMNHWNQSVMLHGKKRLEPEIIEMVFKKIVEHHDALRIIYKKDGENVLQINQGIDKAETIKLQVFDVTDQEDYIQKIEDQADLLQKSIDLEKGPLMKLALFKTKERDTLQEEDHLVVIIHHLVIDAVSWRILLEDFATGYIQAEENEEIIFQDKTHSFMEWSSKIKDYEQGKKIKKESEFWRSIDSADISSLPVDFEMDEDSKVKDSQALELTVSEEDTQKILRQVNKAYNTEIIDILITALGLTVKEWTKQNRVFVSLEGHGRESIIEGIDITRTVGWFTSLYPVLLDVNETEDISYIIRSIKEELRRIPDKGIGYGILRYLGSEQSNCPVSGHTPEIGFNYFGQVEKDINTSLFELSPFSTGQAMSPDSQNSYKLNINGIINNGRLTIAFIYNQQQYKKDTIIKLIESYERNLKSIVNHCIAKEKAELTPSDVGCKELSIGEFEKIYSVWGNAIKKIYRLMPTQQGMLFHTIMDETSHTYFQQIVFEINGDIDLQLLTKSFNSIIERHEILRTNFVFKQVKNPIQIVLQEKPVDIFFEDISDLGENKNSFIEEFTVNDRNKGFNLEKDALIRLSVLKTGEECYKLVWSFHHILMDGWCIGIISKELFETYNALKNDIPLALGKAPVYSDYVEWYEKQDDEEARDYWTHYLEGYENKAVIPKMGNRGQAGRFVREEFSFIINKEITGKLSDIAMENNTTLNIVLQTLWGILLQRYNDTCDVVFGAVMSGRRAEVEGIEEMLGLFINTVPVRVCCDRSIRFNDLLGVMQEDAILSEKYSYYPLVEIQENSLLKNELFDSIMVFENYPLERTSFGTGEDEGLGFAMNFEEAFQQTNYDFNITMYPGEEIGVKITFNSSAYDRNLIKSIEIHLKNAIDKIIENSESAAGDIEILSSREKKKLLVDFNDTKTDDTGYKTISQLFEEQVRKAPDHTAAVFGNRHITYEELSGKANQLAGLLKEKGVGKDCIAGIMVEPSIEMIIAILGVLKAGGAYLPIDAGLPIERISQIVTDSGTKILLSQNSMINEEYAFNTEIINLDDENTYCGEFTNADTVGEQHDLVYVIYTSGTTGVPKGVLVENKGLANYVQWFSKWAELTSSDKTVLLSSFAFDLGYTALYSSLLNGCELHLLRKEEYANPETLINYIEKNKITYIKATPSLFNIIVSDKNFKSAKLDQSLRLVVLGGEKINNEDVQKFHNKYESITIINHYGPTETTIGAIACKIDFEQMEDLNQGPIIGRPISNTQIYILDGLLKPVPIGVPGEIYISGSGLARGYLNRPDITKDKFIQNPFSSEFNSMYKTGDLGRFIADGDIEFLGRKDNQVKIRGYRLEPEEIEANLLGLKNIKDAVVIAGDDKNGNKYLCAYIIQETEQTVSEIRAQLVKQLPDYMIPSYFIALEKWPLTPNGKVDRKALPPPGGSINTGIEYRPPENEVEEILVDIWQEVLGVERIGTDDNFFEMGGHSLKLINLIARIFEAFDVELSPRQVFETPTIRETARYLINGEYKNPHPLMLLNSEKDKKIFFFPPVGGYGLVYKNLADILEEYSCYSFNYIEDSGNRLSMYINYMTEVQKEGPYVLMGWSAGGNLAFEVAKELESKGHKVSDVILVDTHRIINNSNLSEEQISSMVSENLKLAEQDDVYKEYLGKNDFIKTRVANKMEDYFTYLRNKMINSGRLESDIHIILSTDEISPEQDLRNAWNESTSGKFKKYQGFGSHPYMLYTGFVEENSRIVREILTKTPHGI